MLAETGQVENLDDLLAQASRRIATALGLPPNEARLEARVLAARALGVNRAWLVAHGLDIPTCAQASAIETLIHRREQGEPVAYLLGEKEFYGRVFKVSPDVLIPRPETELLVDAVLERSSASRPARILDLGTGSGCIAVTLALECPDCQVWALDRNPAALAVARANARALDAAPMHFLESDWFHALDDRTTDHFFDFIVANPPYIPAGDPHLLQGDVRFEPRSALASGNLGLDDLALISATAPAHLIPGGWLLVEHGCDQGLDCRDLFLNQGLAEVQSRRDLAGHERITLGRQSG